MRLSSSTLRHGGVGASGGRGEAAGDERARARRQAPGRPRGAVCRRETAFAPHPRIVCFARPVGSTAATRQIEQALC
eukprot:5957911-Pleurochrysis_carterae.AAC.2